MNDLFGWWPQTLQPVWPNGIDQWGPFLTLFIAGTTKLLRGTAMYRRAIRIDMFGWSIVLFDWILGGALFFGAIYGVFPRTHHLWTDRLLWTSVMVVSGWQLWTVYAAGHYRVQRAMGAPMESEADGEHRERMAEERQERRDIEDQQERRENAMPAVEQPIAERRREYRRSEDRQTRSELKAYQERYGERFGDLA